MPPRVRIAVLASVAASALAARCLPGLAGLAYASDDAGAPGAVLACAPADGPGRVRCEVEARVGPGESITWGDVVVVDTPPFASTLRGRIGPHDATARDPAVWRWAFALVAHAKGRGDLAAHVRLVVCRSGTCAARELAVVGPVVVGPGA